MTTLNSDTNVVLKLDLGDHGGMRRISIRKVWDESTQTVSFSKLSEIALGLYMSSSSKKLSTRIQDASVTVTYTDEDGDVITISTDDELAEAFGQFVNHTPPVLRASASLRKKTKAKNSDTPVPSVVESKKVEKKVPVETKRVKVPPADKPTSAPTGTDELQDVLENFVGVLTVAVNTLTKNVPEDLSKADEAIEKALHVPVRKDVDCVKSQNKEEDKSVEMNKSEPDQSKEDGEKEETTSNNVPHVPECFDREFIHGRHTCDSCLTTPIIGIRYNATNLPDYDLCQKCIPNYKGSHITFAPSQLERDAQLQPRWKRRHARFLRQAELERRSNRRTMPTTGSGNGPCSLNIVADSDLKEAIRRSLLDANQKRVAPVVAPKQEVEETTQDDEVEAKEEEEKVEEEEKEEPEIPVPCEDLPAETTVCVPKVEEEIEEQDESTVGNQEIKAEEVEEEAIPEVTMTEESDTVESNENQAEDMGNEASASSYKTSAEDIVVDDMTDNDDEDMSLVENEEAADKKQDISTFSMDAEGNGDVARAIGHALDNCAEAIDAMVEEVNKPPSPRSKSSVASSEAGQTIIEGCPDDLKKEDDDNDDKTEASDDSEWQVLSVSSQEMIAQAAQMLGSALFQSDMVDSSNNDKIAEPEQSQTLEHSQSSTSNISSMTIPTVVPSISSKSEIASVVLSRWDDELKQLHELGFLDDHRSVDVLEHLEAANMGCGSDDPVTVEAAINYMLKQA